MKKKLFVYCFLLLGPLSFSQSSDTTALKEVYLKTDKKLKKKTFQFGSNKNEYFRTHSFHTPNESPPPLFSFSVPYGTLSDIILYFGNIPGSIDMVGREDLKYKPQPTTLELHFYKERTDGTLLKLHEDPIRIELKASSKWRLKEKIDLSSYKFTSDKFYVEIRNTTNYSCEKCVYRIPAFYKGENAVGYHPVERSEDGKTVEILKEKPYDFGLRMKVTVLTREY